jgi:hypothetical protein
MALKAESCHYNALDQHQVHSTRELTYGHWSLTVLTDPTSSLQLRDDASLTWREVLDGIEEIPVVRRLYTILISYRT